MPELVEPGHEIVCGATRTGKSFWILYKIVKSIEAGVGGCYGDPKGDTYRNLLAFFSSTTQGRRLWEANQHRIILLNPLSPSDWLVSFNAIEGLERFLTAKPDRLALLADNMTSHIRRSSGFQLNEAMRMQAFLAAGIGILVQGGNGRKYTLAEMPYLFLPQERAEGKGYRTYNAFVESLLPQVDHYGTESFWKLQWPTMLPQDRREWVQSSQNRIFQYLFDERCLMTTCAAKNATLDFNRLVDEGYWLFVNIPYHLLSEQIATLIGNLITTKVFYACMQRPPGSRPFRLILDEARFFNTGPLDRLLETSGAYNLWLTLVVQSLDQMCRLREGRTDETLKDTALQNVRYWSVFNMTHPEDAAALSELMLPLTGTRTKGLRASGDPDWQTADVERDQNKRFLMDLKPRQVILYDKFGGFGPLPPWQTPEVAMDPPTQARIDMFEARHLQLTGRPAEAIMREILERRAEIGALFQPAEKPPTPRPSRPSTIYRRSR